MGQRDTDESRIIKRRQRGGIRKFATEQPVVVETEVPAGRAGSFLRPAAAAANHWNDRDGGRAQHRIAKKLPPGNKVSLVRTNAHNF